VDIGVQASRVAARLMGFRQGATRLALASTTDRPAEVADS
jgi:hypothetical protein